MDILNSTEAATADTHDDSAIRLTLSVEQAARRLGISRSTAYECVRNGSIPSLRFRRRIVIPAVVIEQLLGGVRVDEHGSISAAS